jgi:ribonuclease VapC
MVVDTSALIAIMLLEPEAERFAKAIADARPRLISAANLLEAWIVIESRLGPAAGGDVDEFVVDVGLGIEPVTLDQIRVARRAYRTYGRGNHPAGLNFGDCFAYALAKTTQLPLLFKGDDFARTDVTPAAR